MRADQPVGAGPADVEAPGEQPEVSRPEPPAEGRERRRRGIPSRGCALGALWILRGSAERSHPDVARLVAHEDFRHADNLSLTARAIELGPWPASTSQHPR